MKLISSMMKMRRMKMKSKYTVEVKEVHSVYIEVEANSIFTLMFHS